MESYAGIHGEKTEAAHDLLVLARSTRSRSGGQRWNRNEVHERG